MTDNKNNTGDRNTGKRNTGDWNTGDWNTGDWNAGHQNTGNWNTGSQNTGGQNTGGQNTGYRNTGGWNSCNDETGFFNTVKNDKVRVFNSPCDSNLWRDAKKPDFIFFNLTEWISDSAMTDQEKIDNPSFLTTGGFLKKHDYKEAFKKSWDDAHQEDRELVKQIPNFDADVFFEISGIRVDEKTEKFVEIDGKKYKLVEVK